MALEAIQRDTLQEVDRRVKAYQNSSDVLEIAYRTRERRRSPRKRNRGGLEGAPPRSLLLRGPGRTTSPRALEHEIRSMNTERYSLNIHGRARVHAIRRSHRGDPLRGVQSVARRPGTAALTAASGRRGSGDPGP